ncbi:MAG: hypothetical protein AAF541_17550 [Pseudomonadota bacterium]
MEPAYHSRLQRAPDFTGQMLSTFKDVAVRHGFPGFFLAFLLILLGFFVTEFGRILLLSLAKFAENPLGYAILAVLLFLGLIAYTLIRRRNLDARQLVWTLYLGALSFWEELIFRVALPYYLGASSLDLLTAVILSNLAFGLIHFFTLRWRWQWCLGAFLGGLALSRQMDVHFDLLLITAFHWIGTFVNTPTPPGRQKHASNSK